MEQIELINQAAALINQASQASGIGQAGEAQKHLVKLRELLNEQPELEAGGAQEEMPAEKPAEE